MLILKQILLLAVLSVVSADIKFNETDIPVRHYNEVNYKHFVNFNEFRKAYLNIDDSGKYYLNSNLYLAVPVTEECQQMIYTPNLFRTIFRGVQRQGGNLLSASIYHNEFPYPDIFPEHPGSMCDGQIFHYNINSYLDAPHSTMRLADHQFNYEGFREWSMANTKLALTLTNLFPFEVTYYWHDEGKEPRISGVLRAGESSTMHTSIGHIFSVNALSLKDGEYEYLDVTTSPSQMLSGYEGYKNIVDFFAVTGEEEYVLEPQNRLQTCEYVSNDSEEQSSMEESDVNFNRDIVFSARAKNSLCHLPKFGSKDENSGLVNEEEESSNNDIASAHSMHLRLLQFAHSIWYKKRKGLNYVQPQLVRAASVSPLGFELRALPVSTFAWLKGWYFQEQMKAEVKEKVTGPCMNQLIAPSYVTHLTPELKSVLARELQPILEQWYDHAAVNVTSTTVNKDDNSTETTTLTADGVDPVTGNRLKMTSIYGIRKYINGSVLRMHVDTVSTHVVSAIINVDQEVDEDWPLLIQDHQGNEHKLIMKPGEMVLYESAKLLHGRPDLFRGSHYDNIFIHYSPHIGWDYGWI